ncbi:MAG: hypothetical protein RIE32_12340 [Phycisphaerales bacterium]
MPSAPSQSTDADRPVVQGWPLLDRRIPGAVRRCMWWNVWVNGPMPLVILMAIILGGLGATPFIRWVGVPSLAVVAIGWALFCHASIKRTLRRAAAHEHLLCPECLYDLRTLHAAGACPECGRAYEREAVRAQWVDAQRRLTRK